MKQPKQNKIKAAPKTITIDFSKNINTKKPDDTRPNMFNL
jgi:hypothetical protein